MKKLLFFLALGAFVASCETDPLEEATPDPSVAEKQQAEEPVELEPVSESASEFVLPDDPYLLSNVQKAYDIVVGERKTRAMQLLPTHHYVRFLPQEEAQVFILLNDLGLRPIPYPYNLGLTSEELEVHKNTLINGFAWQYCVVDANMPLPAEVKSELLAHVYYQEEENEDDEAATRIFTRSSLQPQMDSELYDAVYEKTLELTGRDGGDNPKTRALYYPKAHIQYRDKFGNVKNMANIQVLVYNGAMISYSATTGLDGKAYPVKSDGKGFTDRLLFAIMFNGPQWMMLDHNYNLAEWREWQGRGKPEVWHHVIAGDEYWSDAFFASIHRGLQAYYNERRPKADGLVKKNSLNVRAHWNKHNSDNDKGQFRGWAGNQLHVWSKNPNNRNMIDVLSTTFHELGHASHFQTMRDWPYMDVYKHYEDSFICETWAQGVRYAYMSSLYPTKYADYMHYQHSTTSGDHYTAYIESLMNQGFSLRELQNVFMGKRHWYECVQPLKDLRTEAVLPDVFIDYIFDPSMTLTPVDRLKDQFDIAGPDYPVLNADATFETPDYLPTGVTFVEYAITGGNYTTVSGGLTNQRSTVKFNSLATYTITARFRFPNGAIYPISKTVYVTPPAPIISANRTLASKGDVITLTINNHIPGVTYTWTFYDDKYGQLVTSSNNTLTTTFSGSYMVFSCSASANDLYSSHSNTVRVTSNSLIFTPGDDVLRPINPGDFTNIGGSITVVNP